MSYQEFLKEVCEKLQDEFKTAQISCQTVSAINRSKEGIMIQPGRTQAAPVVYFEDIYHEYQKSGDMKSCIKEAVERTKCCMEVSAPAPDVFKDIFSWEKVSKYIYPFLISTKRNEAMLEDMMHRDFLDLSVCYLLRFSEKETGFNGIVRITRDIAAVWERDEDALYQKAMENSRKETYSIQKMNEALITLMEEEGGEDMPESINLSGTDSLDSLSILTNRLSQYGAAGLLRTELLEKFAAKCKSDFYIIPSSIHEVLLLPYVENVATNELNEMVQTVNETNLEEEDILSDHVYYYSREEKQIRCC